MRISTKGRHAVMAMVDLALNAHDKPVSLAEVAERQGISLSYLEQLIARLKSYGLVKSVRGPGGGYMLRMPSEFITVSDVVRAVDGQAPRYHMENREMAKGRELTEVLWQAMSDEISKFLKSVTLADVCQYGGLEKVAFMEDRDFDQPGLVVPKVEEVEQDIALQGSVAAVYEDMIKRYA